MHPLLEALREAKNSSAGLTATSMVVPPISDAAAARTGGNCSPTYAAGLHAPSLQRVPSALEHKTSNLSSYSHMLPSLQHALSGLGNTALNRAVSITSNSLPNPASTLRSQSATAAEFLSRLEAAKAAAQQQQQHNALLAAQHALQRQSSKVGSAAAGVANGGEDDSGVPGGKSDSSCTTRLNSFRSTQLAAKAQQMFSLLGQLSHLQQQQQELFGSAAAATAAAAPTASGDTPSGLTGGDVDQIMNLAAVASAVPAGTPAAAAAAPNSAHTVTGKVPLGCGFQPAELQRVLEDVVKNKKQAAACIREAAALGLIPQVLLQSLRQTVTPSESEVAAAIAKATGLQQQQQPSTHEDSLLPPQLGAKRTRNALEQATKPDSTDTAAAEAAEAAATPPPKKLHRLADGTGLDSKTVSSTEAEAAAAAEDIAVAVELNRTLDRNPSNGSASTDIAVPGGAGASVAAATTAAEGTEETAQQQEVQKAAAAAPQADKQPSDAAGAAAELATAADHAIKDLPQAWSKISASAAAAAATPSMTQAQQVGVLSPAVRELFYQTVLVMSRSQRLCKQLAYMVLPAAQEAQTARQQLQQQQQALQAATTLDIQGLQALQGAVQQLKQQLLCAKVAINVKQQTIVKLQQESQAATAVHTQQLEAVAQAVCQLMTVAKSDELRTSEKQKLVEIAATILNAVVQQGQQQGQQQPAP